MVFGIQRVFRSQATVPAPAPKPPLHPDTIQPSSSTATMAAKKDASSPQTTSAPVGNCDWRPDSPDPLRDDLAHECAENQKPKEHCEWRPDSPERHVDDIGPHWQPVQGLPRVTFEEDGPADTMKTTEVSPNSTPRVSEAVRKSLCACDLIQAPEFVLWFQAADPILSHVAVKLSTHPSRAVSLALMEEKLSQTATPSVRSPSAGTSVLPPANVPSPTGTVAKFTEEPDLETIPRQPSQDKRISRGRKSFQDLKRVAKDVLSQIPRPEPAEVERGQPAADKSIVQSSVHRALSIAHDLMHPKNEPAKDDEASTTSPVEPQERDESLTVLLPEPQPETESFVPPSSVAEDKKRVKEQEEEFKRLREEAQLNIKAARQKARKETKQLEKRERREKRERAREAKRLRKQARTEQKLIHKEKKEAERHRKAALHELLKHERRQKLLSIERTKVAREGKKEDFPSSQSAAPVEEPIAVSTLATGGVQEHALDGSRDIVEGVSVTRRLFGGGDMATWTPVLRAPSGSISRSYSPCRACRGKLYASDGLPDEAFSTRMVDAEDLPVPCVCAPEDFRAYFGPESMLFSPPSSPARAESSVRTLATRPRYKITPQNSW